MRRKDKEITDNSKLKAIIAKSKVCRLGLIDGSKPYIVPLCFGYQKNTLYFHSALKGYKIDLLRKNQNICFEFDLVSDPVESDNACDWGMKYQSIIGFGKAIFLESTDEKREALSVIMAQYSHKQFQFPEKMLHATAVIKVEVRSMTGKQALG